MAYTLSFGRANPSEQLAQRFTLLLRSARSSLQSQETTAPVIACNLKAIKVEERPRYNDLLKKLRGAIRERSGQKEGYAYVLAEPAISLPEVAEWMSMERLCCPFLKLQLSAAGHQQGWTLTLIGPIGVKLLLETEFPIR